MEDWENTEQMTEEEIKRFLSAVIRSPSEKTTDRLKAVSMLLSLGPREDLPKDNVITVQLID